MSTVLFAQDRYQSLHKARIGRIMDEFETLRQSAAANGTVIDPEVAFRLRRQMGLGGSDMAAVLGQSKYKTPFKLWKEKTYREEGFEGNLQTAVGTYLEDFVAQLYENQTGFKVVEADAMVMKSHPFIAGSFDRLVMDSTGQIVGGLECKTAGSNFPDVKDWTGVYRKEWGNCNIYNGTTLTAEGNEINPCYYAQVQCYLAVSGLPWWDLAVLISNSDFRVYRLHPDPIFITKMLNAAEQFWCLNVLDDQQPETTFKDLKDTETTPDSEIQAPAELLDLAVQYKELSKQAKELEAEQDKVKDAIANIMGSTAKAFYMDAKGKKKTLVTFKGTNRSSFDSTAFEAANPKLYNQYVVTKETARSLRVY